MRAIRRVLVATVLLAAAVRPALAQDAPKIKKERDRISREEILASAQKDGDLLAAVAALRPKFLEPPRGTRSFGNSMQSPLLIIVDGNRSSGADALKSLMASTVDEVRWYDPAKAENEFGTAGASGAILVKSWRPKAPPKVTVKGDSTP